MTGFIRFSILRDTALLILFLIALIQGPRAFADDRMLAIVNGETVTVSDYEKFVMKTDPVADFRIIDEHMVRKMIDEKIVLQKARAQGINITDEDAEKTISDFLKLNNISSQDLEKRLTEHGMDRDGYRKLFRDTLLAAKFIDKEIDSRVIVSEDDVLNYYNRNMRMFLQNPETLQVRTIFLRFESNIPPEEAGRIENKAMEIYAEIKDGASFEKLADLYNEDSLKKDAGSLGSFRKGELVPGLDKELARLKDGEVSLPVRTREGIYILKLEKRTEESFVPLEKVKDRISSTLFKQKRQKNYNELIDSLWEKSTIRVNELIERVNEPAFGDKACYEDMNKPNEKLAEALKKLQEKNDAIEKLDSDYRELSTAYDVLSRQYEALSSEMKSVNDRIGRYEIPVVRIAGRRWSLFQIIEENIIASRVFSRLNISSVPWRSGNSYEDFITEQVLYSKAGDEDIREKRATADLQAGNYAFDERERDYFIKYLVVSDIVAVRTAEPVIEEEEIRKYYDENKRKYRVRDAAKVVKYLIIPYTKVDDMEKSVLAADVLRDAVNGKSFENIYRANPDRMELREGVPGELPAVINDASVDLSEGEIRRIITEDNYMIIQVQFKGEVYRRYEDVAGEIREKLAAGRRVPLALWLGEIRKEAEEIR